MGRAFSIKINSRENLSNLSIGKNSNGILVEGDLGEMQSVSLVEGLLIVIEGMNGTLRFEITQTELEQILNPDTRIGLEV